MHIAVAKLTQGSTPPRAFFAGSSSRFIVAQDHLAAWTQKISSPAELGTGSSETQVTEPGATLKPARLWTDIFGETNEQILRQAKTMVKSAIELYPGVSEASRSFRFRIPQIYAVLTNRPPCSAMSSPFLVCSSSTTSFKTC